MQTAYAIPPHQNGPLTLSPSCPPYYRAQLLNSLRRILPNAAAVAQALEAVDLAEFITRLPLDEIAEPFLQLLLAGAKIHAELLLYNIEAARKHRMEWSQFVEEYLLPYVLAGLPVPGAPPRDGLTPYRPHVHVLALRVIDRSPTRPMSMVYSSPEARTHLELTDLYNADLPRTSSPTASWGALERSPEREAGTVELSYGVLPRALLVGQQALTDDFLETAQVA
jgi:hypothetical protein